MLLMMMMMTLTITTFLTFFLSIYLFIYQSFTSISILLNHSMHSDEFIYDIYLSYLSIIYRSVCELGAGLGLVAVLIDKLKLCSIGGDSGNPPPLGE